MFVYTISLRLYECSPRFILQLHSANEDQEKDIFKHFIFFFSSFSFSFFFLFCFNKKALY